MTSFFLCSHLMSIQRLSILFAILLATYFCYSSGLTSYFILDDGVNITKNSSIQIKNLDVPSLARAAASGNAGLGQRPISMLTFAINYYVSGLNGKYFKLVNLVIHLLNGLLVYVFFKWLLTACRKINTLALTDANIFQIAVMITAIWLLHPLNLTAVLYVVQRMTSLSAFFVLAGLASYVYGRLKLIENTTAIGFIWITAGILICTPLAFLSKENGILLPFLVFLLEVTLLQWQASSEKYRKALMLGIGLLVCLLFALGVAYLIYNPSLITAGYQFRDFTLSERLMTEARVLCLYIYLILLPNISVMGLYHDDILVSQALLQPVTTVVSIAALALVIGGAIKWRRKYPIVAFGIGFFVIGHSLESTIFPLEIAYEHRNYLPSLGVLIIPIYYFLTINSSSLVLRSRLVLLSCIVLLVASITTIRANEWKDPFKLRLFEVQRHPLSARAHNDIAGIYSQMPGVSAVNSSELYYKAAQHYQQAASLSSNNLTGLFGLIIINAERNLPVDQSLVHQLEMKLKVTPLSPVNINALIGAERCYSSRHCSIEFSDMKRLFNAALANPTLQGSYKSLALMSYSKIVFNQDHHGAIELVKEAVRLAPDLISNRIAFVELLVASGELKSAAEELEKIKNLKTSGAYRNTINALEFNLRSQTTTVKSSE